MNSIWSETCQIPRRDSLPGDLVCDAAVIGAGMAGILIAAALQQAGCRTVVLEADRIGGGQTRNTTAKITSQHGLIYQNLISTFGRERAGHYAQANEAAVRTYRRLVQEQGISCGWEERSAYLYGSNAEQLQSEAQAAASLGLPARFTTRVSLPFPAAGAVEFQHQAQFHPLKFLKAISDKLTVFEDTPVLAVKGHTVLTRRGRGRAAHIVFAGPVPFVNVPGLYFARMHQERSYVLALRGASVSEGMFLGADPGGVSLRSCGGFLLLGGEGHRTGENPQGGCYDRLRRKARVWFPGCPEAACWSAQDCMTADGEPYIGPYAAGRPYWYVATGFQKWGMTSSMVAALLLRDLICSSAPAWADVFDPGRISPKAAAGILAESGHAAKGLAKCLFQIPGQQASDIPAGQGGIAFWGGKKSGVYRDREGAPHPVKARCPHLGCQLEWNPEERSWDCPCHGSRFDCRGRRVSGPAQEDIAHG